VAARSGQPRARPGVRADDGADHRAADGTADGAAVRPGVRLGVDVGDARIGVARSDPRASLATPVETVPAGAGSVARLVALAAEHGAVEVVLGLPRSLSGREGPAAAKVRAYATALAAALPPVPVRLVDERLSTVTAERTLRDRGMVGSRGRRRRAVVDQQAAVVILQAALDAERARGTAPGEIVGADDTTDGAAVRETT
jgi:putative holliday junction resolvase